MNLQELKARRAHRKVQRTEINEKDIMVFKGRNPKFSNISNREFLKWLQDLDTFRSIEICCKNKNCGTLKENYNLFTQAEKDVVLLRIAENIRFTRHCLRLGETEG